MTKKTLKDLIEIEFDRCSTISEFKSEVFRLIDLYESDKEQVYTTQPILDSIPEEIPYHEICSCNPKNGGSGMCGCTMGNMMVKNPKKYGSGVTIGTTTDKINITSTGTNPFINVKATNGGKSIFDYNPNENIFSI